MAMFPKHENEEAKLCTKLVYYLVLTSLVPSNDHAVLKVVLCSSAHFMNIWLAMYCKI